MCAVKTDQPVPARNQNVLPEGVQLWQGFFFFFFFFFYEGKEDPKSTKRRQSSARQRNAIKWRFAGGPMMAQQ